MTSYVYQTHIFKGFIFIFIILWYEHNYRNVLIREQLVNGFIFITLQHKSIICQIHTRHLDIKHNHRYIHIYISLYLYIETNDGDTKNIKIDFQIQHRVNLIFERKQKHLCYFWKILLWDILTIFQQSISVLLVCCFILNIKYIHTIFLYSNIYHNNILSLCSGGIFAYDDEMMKNNFRNFPSCLLLFLYFMIKICISYFYVFK